MQDSQPDPLPARRAAEATRRYARLHRLFDQARVLEAREREAFLNKECVDDADLLAEVLELLRADADGTAPFSEEEIERGRSELERLLEGGPGRPETSAWMPERIGAYRILSRIGAGGMGVVYEAEQDQPRRRVALKLLHPGQATVQRMQRLRMEAQILGRLQHPGIAQIYEAGSFDLGRGEQPFYAMEYVEGVDLRTFAERRSLNMRARLELVASLCDALQHAHEAGVVHRDLKPDNVLVGEDGRAKVLDFGIAFLTENSTLLSTLVTEEGQILGTLAYMAPEQLVGDSNVITPRADVYSLGVICFELLSGQLPLDPTGLPITAGMQLVANQDSRPLGKLQRRFRGEVETLVGKALAKEPARRYESAEALGADIRRFLDDRPIAARPPSRVYRMRKFARRHKGFVAALLVLALGVCVSTVLALFAQRQTRIARGLEREVATNLYFAEMQLAAHLATEPAGAPRMQELLGHWLPAPGEQDLRGWEWRLLQSLSRPTETVLRGSEGVLAAKWHPTRELFITGERTARVYDAQREAFIAELPTGFRAEDIAWSPAGDAVVLCGPSDLRLFETDTWRELAAWRGSASAQGVTWHPSGAHFLVITNAREVFRFERGSWQATLVHENVSILGGAGMLGYHPGGELLAGLVERRAEALVLDARTWEVVARLPCTGSGNNMTCLNWDPRGERLAIGTSLGPIQVFRKSDWKLERVIEAHAQFVTEVSWSPSGEVLASACRDSSVQLSDPSTGRLVKQLRGHTLIAEYASWNGKGDRIVSTSGDGTIRLWEVGEPSSLWTEWSPDAGWVADPKCSWSPDGRHLATDRGDDVQLWEFREGRLLQLPGSLVGTSAFWDPRGDCIATRDEKGLSIYDWRNGELVDQLDLGISFGFWVGIDWSPARARTLAVAHAGKAWIVDLEAVPRAHLLLDNEQYARTVDWSPDGRTLLICQYFLASVYDADTDELLTGPSFPGVRIQAGTWSPDGARVAFTLEDLSVRILRADTWAEEFALRGHVNQVHWSDWSPDGERIATGSSDGTVKVWDTATGQLAASLQVGSPVQHLEWSPGGEQLATMAYDRTLRIWNAVP